MKIYALGVSSQNKLNRTQKETTFGFYNPPTQYVPPSKEAVKMAKYAAEVGKFLTMRAKNILNVSVGSIKKMSTDKQVGEKWVVKIMKFIAGYGNDEAGYTIEKYYKNNGLDIKGTKPVKIVTTKEKGKIKTILNETQNPDKWEVKSKIIRTEK